ncbi:MAG: ATP-binding protein [Anaerolineae bacterium]
MVHERILVVDDEPQIVRLCVEMLAPLGFEVHGMTSSLEALTRLKSESFDLLIADVKMPQVDGLTLLRQAREFDPNLTVVIITGYATLDKAIQALNAGARGFVLKPFGFEELTQAVKEALTQRQREQERQRLQAQVPILEISQTLLTEADVESLAHHLLEVVARQTQADRAALMLLEKDELRVAAVLGWSKEAGLGLRRSRIGPQTSEQILNSAIPWVVTPDSGMTLEPPFQAWVQPGLSALVLVPLRTAKNPVGILSIGYMAESRPKAVFSSSELNLLSILGGQLAIALDNARMYATEQRRAAALARALEQQQELDRLKSEFIQNVSHELRTPLSMILAYAELLVSGELGELEEPQKGALEVILERSLVLRDLVEQITALWGAGARAPVRELVDLTELVEAASTDFKALAERSGLTLSTEIEFPVPPIYGEVGQLRKVIDNLVANALKFTPTGGQVTIRLGYADGQAVLQVADTGIGIAPEHHERIFERFYQVDGTTRRRYGGSGLGLAVVKEITEAHGGAVMVQSRLGQGSTFTVTLPTAAVSGRPESREG